jgi:glycosyltransferase involved in cell wall biosynthesis
MNILFLCNKSPYPPKEGGPIAMNVNIGGLVKAGHSVKVIALNTNKYFIDPQEIPEKYKSETDIEFVYTDLSIKPVEAFANLFSSKSYHVERFVSHNVNKKLIQILKDNSFDIVQLEMLYMAPYIETIKQHSNARVILRAHNIEHLIWERITSVTKNPLKKWYIGNLTKKLKNYELSVMDKFDGIATITAKDAEFFRDAGCRIPLTDIPFGIDVENYKPQYFEEKEISLFHLGSMNWMPNEEGVRWFLDKVWPLIHKKSPKLKFYLAGRMMPDWLTNLKIKNVEVVGEVDDATEFINKKGIMIVPLLSGSGIRIKIIEGMALGKTIISTTIGAEGINYEDGKDILIANTPEEFSKVVEKCILDRNYCSAIGRNARKLIENDHNISKIIGKLEDFYKTILEN